MTDAARPSVEEIHAALGRCVLLYQFIEHYLKVLLPNLIRTDGTMCDDPYVEMQSLLASTVTLGPLMERLKESCEVSRPGQFRSYLTAVVANRNELIHGFVRQPFAALESAESRALAMNYLHVKHAFALPLFAMLRQLLASLDGESGGPNSDATPCD